MSEVMTTPPAGYGVPRKNHAPRRMSEPRTGDSCDFCKRELGLRFKCTLCGCWFCSLTCARNSTCARQLSFGMNRTGKRIEVDDDNRTDHGASVDTSVLSKSNPKGER